VKIEDYIGIYAAFVSTFLLIWEVYKHITDKKSRMLVTGSFRHQANVYYGGGVGEVELFFWIEVINRGNYQKLIQKPGFESNIRNGEKFHSLLDLHDKNKYPYPLGPGEVYNYYFKADSFDHFKKQGVRKVRIVVNDTTGKKYHSRWIKI